MNAFVLRITLLVFLPISACVPAATPGSAPPRVSRSYFDAGTTAYRAANYETAATLFREASAKEPSSGSFLNLGNSEWQRGRVGYAILAWERALWVDPFNRAAKDNLDFARGATQLDSPYLAWYEVASSWLPSAWWAWLAGVSLWFAIGAVMLPGILRWRRSGFYHVLAALGFAFFLLSLPAHLGVATRSRLAFVLERETPLCLTPTREGQVLTRLAAGEPLRIDRKRGSYYLVSSPRFRGWVEDYAVGIVGEPQKAYTVASSGT